MPPSVYTQSVIALVWDFDKTLSLDYMQTPLFEHYGVNASQFWHEVDQLAGIYRKQGCEVLRDTIYLNHILTYVREGIFRGLTNDLLRELGGKIAMCAGIPEFFQRTRAYVESQPRYAKHSLRVEHYIVSTGLRPMIQGSPVGPYVDGIWACDLLPAAPFLSPDALPLEGAQEPTLASDVVAQVGYTMDNTGKTRALFEINKGVNKDAGFDVNSLVPGDQRRVPLRHMIYIADGPSDIPCFSVLGKEGGKRLAVYSPLKAVNYENAAQLLDQGRVDYLAEANYTEGSPADKWLMRSITRIADEICDTRERVLDGFARPPSHVN